MHTNSGSPCFKRFAHEADVGFQMSDVRKNAVADNAIGLLTSDICHMTSDFKSGAFEAGVTAYLLYNGSATYVA